MSIKDLLGKAFKISTSKEYIVKFFNENDIRSEKVMSLTYLQLGIELVNNHPVIKEVHIIYKDNFID